MYFSLFCSIIVIRNGKEEELKEMEPEEKEKDAEKSPTVSWISSLYCVHNVLQKRTL